MWPVGPARVNATGDCWNQIYVLIGRSHSLCAKGEGWVLSCVPDRCMQYTRSPLITRNPLTHTHTFLRCLNVWKGSFWYISNSACSHSGAIQRASLSCWVVHLLPHVYESVVKQLFWRFQSEQQVKRPERMWNTNIHHWTCSESLLRRSDQVCATGRCFSCGLIAPDSLSPNTVTLPPSGRRSAHTRCITHTHSFTMCHRANYQESGCKRGRVIQVSIPEPPLGSRIRRQKTVRDTEGCQSDIRQQHTSPPRKGRRVGLLLANQGLIWLWLKGAFVAVIPPETEGGETNCF